MPTLVNDLEMYVKTSGDSNTGEFYAAYFQIRSGTVVDTRELIDGLVFADFGADDQLLGIELLGFCEPEQLAAFVKDEPEAVKHFVHWAAPKQLVTA